MQEFIDSAKDWWAFLAGLVAIGFWFARLEWRGKQNRSDIASEAKQRAEDMMQLERRIDRQRKEDRAQLAKQRAEDRESRNAEWAEMRSAITTIQTDIKEILKGIKR